MKKAFIILIALTFTSFTLSYVFAMAAGDLPYPNSTFKSVEAKLNEDLKQIDETELFSAENLQHVELKVGLAQLSVGKSPDDQVHLRLQGRATRQRAFEVQQEKGTLKIKIDSAGQFQWLLSDGGVSIRKGSLKAELLLPTSFRGELSAKVGSGDIDLRDLNLKAIEVKTGNGSVTSSALAGQLKIKTGNGDVNVALGEQSLWTVNVNVGRGELVTDFGGQKTTSGSKKFLTGNGPHQLEIKTGNGDVHLTL